MLLVVLVVAGSGWAVALLRRPWWERAAFAPAFGLGTLVMGGFAADRIGLSLDGLSGAGVAVALAAGGSAVAAARVLIARRRRRDVAVEIGVPG